MSRVPGGGGGFVLPKQPRRVRRPAPGKHKPPPGWQQPGPVPPGGGGGLQPPVKRARHATHAKKAKRGLARSASEVACCAAEALAASLRLAGGTVRDEDVLALYWHTAHSADTGASILATLEAAAEHGLAGFPGPLHFCRVAPSVEHPVGRAGDVLILGVDLPGPHTVLDDGEAWWSWGEPFDPASFPDVVIEEAWAVTWHG